MILWVSSLYTKLTLFIKGFHFPAVGSGQSKKKAKHAAAKAVLDKIWGGRSASMMETLGSG